MSNRSALLDARIPTSRRIQWSLLGMRGPREPHWFVSEILELWEPRGTALPRMSWPIDREVNAHLRPRTLQEYEAGSEDPKVLDAAEYRLAQFVEAFNAGDLWYFCGPCDDAGRTERHKCSYYDKGEIVWRNSEVDAVKCAPKKVGGYVVKIPSCAQCGDRWGHLLV